MKTILTFVLTFLFGTIVSSQPIPIDSLYLGQTFPGNHPVIFNLSINNGSFAAERIAISDDNKEIYYSEVHSYYPTTGDTIKYYRYSGGNWTGPFNLFQGYLAPALSYTGDTMFFQNNSSAYESFFSVRNGINWSNPQRLLANLNSAHYLQVTNTGHYYISSVSNPTIGAGDWCKLLISGDDTTAISLGLPINSTGDNLDFFVSKDETYMILAKSGLKISYHKGDGSWTNPKDLGSQINFGLSAWGPYVTDDNKYLFYTTGTQANYSDTYVYWVRIDSLMDSLMHTNFIPYVKKAIPYQYDTVGVFFNFTIPDSTFFDDDGNNTLTYAARIANGSPLPAWLTFDTITRTFSGIPAMVETLLIKVTATDTGGASASTNFKITINAPASIDKITGQNDCISIFPNPTNDYIRINYNGSDIKSILIVDILGNIVYDQPLKMRNPAIDVSVLKKGLYFLKLQTRDNKTIVSKFIRSQ